MQEVLTWITCFLVVVIELVVGVILKFFTPKFNPRVGFRTENTLKSEKKWEYGNKLAGTILIILGIIEMIIFLIVFPLFLSKYYIQITLTCGLGEGLVLLIAVCYADFKTKNLIEDSISE